MKTNIRIQMTKKLTITIVMTIKMLNVTYFFIRRKLVSRFIQTIFYYMLVDLVERCFSLLRLCRDTHKLLFSVSFFFFKRKQTVSLCTSLKTLRFVSCQLEHFPFFICVFKRNCRFTVPSPTTGIRHLVSYFGVITL